MTTTHAPSGDAITHASNASPPSSPVSGIVVSPKMTAPLSGCVTIDSTRPDLYLSYAKTGTPASSNNSSVQTAAGGLASCLGGKKPAAQPGSIVGHGASGVIVTGAGQQLGTPDQHINHANSAIWNPLFSPLQGTMTSLFLYGCSVGAGAAGSQLLHEIAQTVGCNVYAPTGLIYCDSTGNFSLEKGAQWQMASPQQAPGAIEAPDVAEGQVVSGGHEVRLHVLENVLITSLDQLSHAAFEPHPWTGVSQVRDDILDQLVREVHWHKPFTPPGQHAALFTASLTLTFGYGERAIRKVFSVFNHTLLQDMDHPHIHYRATGRWLELLS